MFVVNDNRARLRPVELGQRNSDAGQILKGLQPGEIVILHPPDTLTDGARVIARAESMIGASTGQLRAAGQETGNPAAGLLLFLALSYAVTWAAFISVARWVPVHTAARLRVGPVRRVHAGARRPVADLQE